MQHRTPPAPEARSPRRRANVTHARCDARTGGTWHPGPSDPRTEGHGTRRSPGWSPRALPALSRGGTWSAPAQASRAASGPWGVHSRHGRTLAVRPGLGQKVVKRPHCESQTPQAPPMPAEAPPTLAEALPMPAEAPPMLAEAPPTPAEAPPPGHCQRAHWKDHSQTPDSRAPEQHRRSSPARTPGGGAGVRGFTGTGQGPRCQG